MFNHKILTNMMVIMVALDTMVVIVRIIMDVMVVIVITDDSSGQTGH